MLAALARLEPGALGGRLRCYCFGSPPVLSHASGGSGDAVLQVIFSDHGTGCMQRVCFALVHLHAIGTVVCGFMALRQTDRILGTSERMCRFAFECVHGTSGARGVGFKKKGLLWGHRP